MINIRTYKKMIREANAGDRFYLNAINASISMIEYTKLLIKSGKLEPVADELDKMIKKEYQESFFNGEKLAPQMTYIIK